MSEAASGIAFEVALTLVKSGGKIHRRSWNGKGMSLMYVVAQKGYPDGIAINENTAKAIGQPVGTVQRFVPYLMLRTADGVFAPWTPTQVDLFARDWALLADDAS